MTEPPCSSGGSQARDTEVLVLSVTLGWTGGPGGSVNQEKETRQKKLKRKSLVSYYLKIRLVAFCQKK